MPARAFLIVLAVVATAAGSGCGSSLAPADGGSGSAGSTGSGTGMGGGAGAEGGAGGSVAGELLRGCPDTPPTAGCQPAEVGLVCNYPTQSCVCNQGTSWDCYPCPASQPTSTGGAFCSLGGGITSPACQYGNVTCGCVGQGWGCGVCPAAHPQTGDACGNTSFRCRYGDDTCRCDGGVWSCTTASCPLVTGEPFANLCSGATSYTCGYAALDQICRCGEISTLPNCSCPSATPVDGSLCAAPAGPCRYDDAECACNSGHWECVTKVCPAAKPAAGAACSQVLSCMYGGSFCACDGSTWSC